MGLGFDRLGEQVTSNELLARGGLHRLGSSDDARCQEDPGRFHETVLSQRRPARLLDVGRKGRLDRLRGAQVHGSEHLSCAQHRPDTSVVVERVVAAISHRQEDRAPDVEIVRHRYCFGCPLSLRRTAGRHHRSVGALDQLALPQVEERDVKVECGHAPVSRYLLDQGRNVSNLGPRQLSHQG